MAGAREFDGIPAATVYEAMGRRGDMAPDVRPVVPGTRLAGPAFTVKCPVGDALAVFRALEQAKPGDVLVIDAGATARATAWGGTMTRAAIERKLAGCVTNGAIRDTAEIRELGFAAFGTGTSVRGPLVSHPGWLGVAISVGDVVVSPGDLIIADDDGVVVVPVAEVAEIALKSREQFAYEAERDRRVEAGEGLAGVLKLNL